MTMMRTSSSPSRPANLEAVAEPLEPHWTTMTTRKMSTRWITTQLQKMTTVCLLVC